MSTTNWPKVNCKKCKREIYLVRTSHGQWFPYDIKPFQPREHGLDVYDLPEHKRTPLFIPRDNKYTK